MLGAAEFVGAADLDGDGQDELFLSDAGSLRWTLAGKEQALALPGVLQAVAEAPAQGALLIATGIGRGHLTAPAQVQRITQAGPELVWTGGGPRPQVSELRIVGSRSAERVWLGVFTDPKQVAMGWLEEGQHVPLQTVSMALRSTPLGQGLAIGRLYGDDAGSDGELRLLAPEAASGDPGRLLPSLRGVRALAAADLDDDGQDELVVGDGWHQAYGKEGDPRIVLFDGPKLERQRAIAWLPGNYAVLDLSVDSSIGGSPVILATGNRSAWLLQRDGLGWSATELGDVAEGGNAVWATRGGQRGVLLSGKPARFLPLVR
jgi:hypothetical protein